MKPLDPRLVRRSHAARWFLVAGAALAVVQAAAVIAFAWSLASLVAGLIDGMRMPQAWPLVALLLVAASARAGAAWLWDVVGSAGATRVKAELRADLLRAIEDRPGGVPGFPTARIATLLGPGLDALDEYFGRYLPQLVLTVIATPAFIVAAWLADPLSGLILVIVLPLIPIFMALIGMATAAVQRRQWDSLAALSRGFLEVVGGLSTLVVFGRTERQTTRIRRITDEYRRGTMRVLRITFLSGFTLELAASLSVALVAVSIGLRLVGGDMTLLPGLFVLVLAPEVFLPLRNVGAAFHSSSAGVTASADAFDVLAAAEGAQAARGAHAGAGDRAVSAAEAADGTDTDAAGLVIRDLRVRRGDRVVLDGFDLQARPGDVIAITGESGSGKSSIFAALLGFAGADGAVRLDGRTLASGDRSSIAWAGQTPALVAGTVADNVRLGDEHADPALLARALDLAGVDLPPEQRLGPSGGGLSGGQAQRVATARAIHRLLARDARLLLLDEPGSAQDPEREARLAGRLRELAADGRVVLVTTHRSTLAEAADRTIDLAVVHA
ncbi:thiol reductant ABC exporter subunit CydD [Agromyces mariniharenae]|uniref:Thiol reductant ABC exporter subunit CydD n=1 Tax=Agromyces mariniharenae TaxID=2604423 RepID=A0A5S4V3H0_9MICO|nr:thiol reductant ABC exporter subunit CydD [Agromyces mariniharenae]TYL51060.1 thiol reductant ABC exporter subunit CydD [Agromyces mariniharenae]